MSVGTIWESLKAADAPTLRHSDLGYRLQPGQSFWVIITCSKIWKPLPQNYPHSRQQSLMPEILKPILLVLSLSLVQCQYPWAGHDNLWVHCKKQSSLCHSTRQFFPFQCLCIFPLLFFWELTLRRDLISSLTLKHKISLSEVRAVWALYWGLVKWIRCNYIAQGSLSFGQEEKVLYQTNEAPAA